MDELVREDQIRKTLPLEDPNTGVMVSAAGFKNRFFMLSDFRSMEVEMLAREWLGTANALARTNRGKEPAPRTKGQTGARIIPLLEGIRVGYLLVLPFGSHVELSCVYDIGSTSGRSSLNLSHRDAIRLGKAMKWVHRLAKKHFGP